MKNPASILSSKPDFPIACENLYGFTVIVNGRRSASCIGHSCAGASVNYVCGFTFFNRNVDRFGADAPDWLPDNG